MKKVNGAAVNSIPTINGESNPTSVDEFEPLWDFILTKQIKDNITKSGLIMPDGASVDSLDKGLVVKAGPGAYKDNGVLVPNPIKEGDIVFYLAFRAPFLVVLNGEDYLCMSGRDCVAITKRKGAVPEVASEPKRYGPPQNPPKPEKPNMVG